MAIRQLFNDDRHEYYILPDGRRILKRYVPVDELCEKYYLMLTKSENGKLLEYCAFLSETQELEGFDSSNIESFMQT